MTSHSIIAVLVAASCLSTTPPAIGQQHVASADPDVGSPTAASALLDLEQNSLTGEDIRTLDAFRSIRFVRLDDIFQDRQREALQDVLAGTEDGFAEVQVAIRTNELVKAAFAQEGIDVGNAIAMTGQEGGDLIVYLDEPVIRQ